MLRTDVVVSDRFVPSSPGGPRPNAEVLISARRSGNDLRHVARNVCSASLSSEPEALPLLTAILSHRAVKVESEEYDDSARKVYASRFFLTRLLRDESVDVNTDMRGVRRALYADERRAGSESVVSFWRRPYSIYNIVFELFNAEH